MIWSFAIVIVLVVVWVIVLVARRRKRAGETEQRVAQLKARGLEAGICPTCRGAGRLKRWKVCPDCHGLGYWHRMSDGEIFKT